MAYRGVSAGEIHRRTGVFSRPPVAQSTIGRVLAGARAPDLDTVSAICKAVDFPPWQLLVSGFDPANPPIVPKMTKEEAALYDRLSALIHNKK